MISAVAPPGMPIERGMTASWIQRLVNLGPGNMTKLWEALHVLQIGLLPGLLKQSTPASMLPARLKKIIYYSSKQQAAPRP